jgi:hypothetical protein
VVKRPEDHGHWEGSLFVFNEPLVLTDGDGGEYTIKKLDTGSGIYGDGLTPQDVVYALLNSIAAPVDGP